MTFFILAIQVLLLVVQLGMTWHAIKTRSDMWDAPYYGLPIWAGPVNMLLAVIVLLLVSSA